jgi:hypothetical protein
LDDSLSVLDFKGDDSACGLRDDIDFIVLPASPTGESNACGVASRKFVLEEGRLDGSPELRTIFQQRLSQKEDAPGKNERSEFRTTTSLHVPIRLLDRRRPNRVERSDLQQLRPNTHRRQHDQDRTHPAGDN